VTRFYDIDEANEALPEVGTILTALRDQRLELIRLRDEALERSTSIEATAGDVSRPGPGDNPESEDDLRIIRLRMQGVVDRMQAGVARLVELSIQLRDIETGLIDFPALVAGRQVWLCWRLGEGDVEWWHELSTGFSGRQALADLS
jgi:hypothetical protein